MKKDIRKKITFVLDDLLYNTLQAEAERESISVSALIRRMLLATFEPERLKL